MATAIQKTVRRGLVNLLRTNAALTAVVPASRIHPKTEPAWPFIKLASPTTQRLRAACVNGGLVTWDIHAFARDRKSGNATVEYAEDHAGRIGGLIEAALSDRRVPLEDGSICHIELSDMRLLEDGEPEAFHYFAQINCRVLAA